MRQSKVLDLPAASSSDVCWREPAFAGSSERRLPLRSLAAWCLWVLAWVPAPAEARCGSHELEILPPQPTVADSIRLQITGVCPTNSIPQPAAWTRDGSLIRVDSSAVLGGVPSPDGPYELLVDFGFLAPGRYRAEYFLELFAAPTAALGASPPPDAVLEFEVSDAAIVPALDARLLALLAVLLAFVGRFILVRR